MIGRFALVPLFLALGCLAAEARNGAPSRLFPYYEEDAGVLLLGQAVYVGTRQEIVGSNTHYQFMLSTGIADQDITDGRMIVVQLYCCGGKISEDQAIWAYVPPAIAVEREDLVEIRMGRVPGAGDPGVVNTVTAVRQKAAAGSGPCRWEPDTPGLWMRVAHCDGMEQQGWAQRGKWRKLWYRPAGMPDPEPVSAPADSTAAIAAGGATVASEPVAAPGPEAPAEQVNPEAGVVYVYHLSDSSYAKGMGTLALRRAMIYMDDQEVAALTHGTHVRIEVPPGPHTFVAKVSIYGLPGLSIGNTVIDVEKGGTYYLHYFEQKMGAIGGYVSQHMITEDAQSGAEGVRHTRAKPIDGGG